MEKCGNIECVEHIIDTEENAISEETIFQWWKDYFEIMDKNDYLSMFIKIPFCKQRCKYCLFFNYYYNNSDQMDKYLDDLESQIVKYSELFKDQTFRSLYIGGGTPSVLTVNQIKRLFNMLWNNFNFDIPNNVFAFESNVESLDYEKIDYLRSTDFINRVSVGIQSFSPQVLDFEGRLHIDFEESKKRLNYLMDAFSDINHLINVDLMAGLFNQPVENLINDFNLLSSIGTPKITVYSKIQSPEHNEHQENVLNATKNMYIDRLLEKVEMEGLYDFEKVFFNKNFYNFIRKDFKFNFDHIYIDKPGNLDGKLNSVLGLGAATNSWIKMDTYYRQKGIGEYKYHNPLYWQKEITISNYNSKFLCGERKRFYS